MEAQLQIESLQQPSSRTLTSHRTQVLSMDIADLTAFVTHPTNGLQKFEHLLRTDRYCTVPEALAQTFLVLASPTMTISEKADQPPTVSPPLQVDMQYLFVFTHSSHKLDEMYCALKNQADPRGWVKLYNESKVYHYVLGDKLKVDQDLRTATISLCRTLYELGPIQCNLSQVFPLLACTKNELRDQRIYAGFNERGLNDSTSESMFQKYKTLGYKGTGTENVNHICLLTDAELTAVCTLSQFDDSTVIPEPLPQLELYQLLREALEDRAKCTAFVERWEQFKHFFPKVPDADEKKAFRSKMFGCASGQNRMNSAHRMSTPEEGDAVWFKSMERWTMTFWKFMPRVLARYCSEENQGRDGCSQTKLPAEQILKACDSRNRLIAWGNNHIRWSSLSPAEQVT